MADEILTKEPKRVWHYFNEICKIPHGSGNEDALRKYLIKTAEKLGIKHRTDPVGNVVLCKDGSEEFKNAKPLIFQGHMDMVCETTQGSGHDFSKDPIVPKVEGEWLTTGGKTTLGSDNGVGLAICLALLEDKAIKHGPIECLFTTSEETGMDGAIGMDKGLLAGRTMINLDSEDEGVLFVGCAGGCNSIVCFPISRKSLSKDQVGLSITVNGLRGGHSGLVIHEQRANAIKVLGRILYEIHRKQHITLSSINGGSRHNVIPNMADAVIAFKKTDRAKVVGLIENLESQIAAELKTIDPNFKVTVKDVDARGAFGQKLSDKSIAFLNAAPNGVVRMSYDIQGLVQTSTNLATARVDSDFISFLFLSRSSSASDLEAIKGTLASCAELCGAEVEESSGYPGWQPNTASPILKLIRETYKKIFDKEASYTAIHAGLECGIIGEKFPGMDMISLGPDIRGAHSVNEKVCIESVEKIWKLLIKVVENFAKV